MVATHHAVGPLLILLTVGITHAHPIAEPKPFSLSGLINDIQGAVDKVKNAIFSSSISGTLAPALLPDLLYFAEYSAAAYCDPNHIPGTEVTCPRNICPTVSQNTVTTVLEFSEGITDTTGIIALDTTTRSIVLSFRGSHSVRNWLTNFAVTLGPASWCSGCQVHSGFLQAYADQAPRILKSLSGLKSAYPGYRIVTTGHSLGGALAQIAAIDLRSQGWDVSTYTYGSPRIGNDKLSAFATTQGAGKNFRVTHTDDPVPRLPLMIMGYQHVSPEYHITRDLFPTQATWVNILKGGVNWGGNTADDGVVSIDVLAHLKYLLKVGIADCASFSFEI